MNIVFLDESTINLNGDMDFSGIRGIGNLTLYPMSSQEEAVQRAKDAEVVIVNKVLIREQELSRLPNAKHIAVIATGYNNVDLEAARKRGVTVTNVSGYGRYIVPQHAFSLILNLAGAVIAYVEDVRNGDWARAGSFTLLRYPTFELAGKTLGIIGFGAIGRGVAKIAEGFSMRVLANDIIEYEYPPYRNSSFDEVLAGSDIVTIHTPLTEQTRNMIGKDEFRKMKKSALIVNTARGGIIDEEALLWALESGEIAGAGLDVIGQEPPGDTPLLKYRGKNLIITPHSAWSARESRQRLIDGVAENVTAWLQGKSRNVVN